MIGDDLAGQGGPLFLPDFYREVVKPRQKKLVQHIKSLTGAKIWYHTCGSCVEYIPDLLDNGIDILNPVQITGKGMDPEFLKEVYGNELVFWGGGIDSQHVLPFADTEAVKKNVRGNIEIFKQGGGVMFSIMFTTYRLEYLLKILLPCMKLPINMDSLTNKKQDI